MLSGQPAYSGDPFLLPGLMEYRRIQICQTCGGNGYDPERTGQVCRNCDGVGLYLGEDPIELPDGNLLILTGEHGAPSDLGALGLAYDFIESTSAWVETVLIMPKDEWTGSMNANAYNYLAVLYFAQGDGPCATCGGSGKAAGDPYVDGDALPVPLVNYLKTEVSFTAEKTLEGKPASEPFTFILLETDEERRTEKEIARTQNGTDGKIAFNPVALNPATPQTYYFIVREVADAENSTIAYDTGEDIYRVTVSLDNDGIPVVDKKLMSGDGVFRNTYKGGSLAIEIKTGGYIPHWPWWQPPKFPVNVVLKDREGRPLAGHPLPTSSQKVKISAKAANGVLTVSDVMNRAEGTTANVTDSEGRGTILIEGGSIATIAGLPDGVTYEVSQPEDSMPKGYSQGSAEGTTGTIKAGQVSKATFENNYQGEGEGPEPTTEQPKPSAEPTPSDKPTDEPTVKPTEGPTATPAPTNTPKPQPVPKTGDTGNPLLWVGMILLGLIGIGGLTYGKFRKKK